MASLLFTDITKPDLYTPNGHFQGGIQNLLLFAQRIYDEHLSTSNIKTEDQPRYHQHLTSNTSSSWSSALFQTAEYVLPFVKEYYKHKLRDTAVKDEAELLRQRRRELEEERDRIKRLYAYCHSRNDEDDTEGTNLGKSKPKNDDAKARQNIILASTVATAAASASISIYSAYKTTQHVGKQAWHLQLNTVISECEEILSSTKHWISERKSLGFPIPDVVSRDLKHLEHLIDFIQRLDDSIVSKRLILAFLCSASSAAVLAYSVLTTDGLASFRSNLISQAAVAGLGISVAYYAAVKGLYSSNLYQESRRMFARKVKGIVEDGAWRNEEVHAMRVVEALRAMRNGVGEEEKEEEIRGNIKTEIGIADPALNTRQTSSSSSARRIPVT